MLTDDEAIDVKGTLGKAVDQTVALSVLHHDNLAPIITPVAIEEKFVINLDNYPYDLAGTVDIRTAAGLRDTKTKAITPPENAARTLQGAMYCMAHEVNHQKLPALWTIDFLVKTKTPKVEIRTYEPDKAWIDVLRARLVRATECIQAVKEGRTSFVPADAESWICSKKFCGYHADCPYWSGR
jgi:hypothetical protein